MQNKTVIKSGPQVGIFFFIGATILSDSVAVEKGEKYGAAIQYGEHYNFWEAVKPATLAERKFKARAYDAFPRGRVVYFPDGNKYRIYYDTCLRMQPDLNRVIERFNLELMDTEIEKDEHYQCAKCNPNFLD